MKRQIPVTKDKAYNVKCYVYITRKIYKGYTIIMKQKRLEYCKKIHREPFKEYKELINRENRHCIIG
jgi:hypothetical protein